MTNQAYIDAYWLHLNNPRDYALSLVYESHVSANAMLVACLKAMSHDDVRSMLDANELSPRFIYDEED